MIFSDDNDEMANTNTYHMSLEFKPIGNPEIIASSLMYVKKASHNTQWRLAQYQTDITFP